MTLRGASAEVLAEIGKAVVRPVHLLDADFQPWIYLTDAAANLGWGGQTYLASQFLGFSGIQETADLLVNSCSISLSGVDQSVVALLLQERYFNRRVRIRKAFLTESLQIVGSPLLVFEGRMARPTITVDPDTGTANCSVEAASIWSDFERRPGRHTNDAEQQRVFPGDKGFSKISGIPRQINWGVSTALDSPRAKP